MTSNYYTLLNLSHELRPSLGGRRFQSAYSFRPNELRIVLDAGTLVAVLRPISGGLFLSPAGEARPKHNVRSFFAELAGKEITAIEMASNDRSLKIHFGELCLRLNYFGTPNALLVRAGETLASFKRESERAVDARTPGSMFPMLGKKYLAEVTEGKMTLEAMDRLLRHASGAIVYRSESGVLLSLVPLRSQRNSEESHYESLNEAARITIIERAKLDRLGSLKRHILTDLQSELARLERSRIEMQKGAENSDRAERYLAIANAILMVAHEIPDAAETWRVAIEGDLSDIRLDKDLNAYENATAYFERAKRAKESKAELNERAKQLRESIAGLRSRIEAVEGEQDVERLSRQIKSQKTKAIQKGPDGSSFREFTVAGGLRVLVGKNAKQNDELTLHVARKEDMWLHARGVPGSHVVLQSGNRGAVPREAIEQAAEIAAFYSDARTQSIAPVAYTPKKYVRKPRGAAPGAVKLEREEVIMVRPQVRGKGE